jgi:hypothetical protein
MRKLMLAAALALGAFGCSHTCQEAKADYHHDGVHSAAQHEQQKTDADQAKANYAPLP